MSGAARARDRGLAADSRQVRPGFLFAALPGASADGRRFVARRDRARRHGRARRACTTLPATDRRRGSGRRRQSAPRAGAGMAARFYRAPAAHGRRGHRHQRQDLGRVLRPPDLGGARPARGEPRHARPGGAGPSSRPAPDHARSGRAAPRLAELAAPGIDHLAIEASSHGLDQYRLDGVRVAAAAFTNLTRDHLDYHGTMAAYLATPSVRLFAELLAPGGDGCAQRRRARVRRARGAVPGARPPDHRLRTRRPADLRLSTAPARRPRDSELVLDGPSAERHELLLAGCRRVPGDERAGRARPRARRRRRRGTRARVARRDSQGVRGAHRAGGAAPERRADLCRLCAHARRARDRADGAASACREALVVVFGCGGDRDRGKRPVMGEIADAPRRPRHRHRRQSAQRGSGRDPRRDPGRRPRARSRSATAREAIRAGDRRARSRRPAGHRRQGPRAGPDRRRAGRCPSTMPTEARAAVAGMPDANP